MFGKDKSPLPSASPPNRGNQRGVKTDESFKCWNIFTCWNIVQDIEMKSDTG